MALIPKPNQKCHPTINSRRKNWLFSGSPQGAPTSAIAYSIVKMAKANKLNICKYLTYTFDQREDNNWSDKRLESITPWNGAVIDVCKITKMIRVKFSHSHKTLPEYEPLSVNVQLLGAYFTNKMVQLFRQKKRADMTLKFNRFNRFNRFHIYMHYDLNISCCEQNLQTHHISECSNNLR